MDEYKTGGLTDGSPIRMAEATQYEFLDDEKTANGFECGQALISAMNLWNCEFNSEEYFRYRRIVQRRVSDDVQVLSDLFDLVDGQLKYRAVTMLTNDAGMVKPEDVTLDLIAIIINYDFILDSFYVEAHRDVRRELPKRVNNWMPFLGEVWEGFKSWKYKAINPDISPIFPPDHIRDEVIMSQYGPERPYPNRNRFAVSYDGAVKALQTDAKELWLVNTISDEEVKEVVEGDKFFVKGEDGEKEEMVVLSESEPRIAIKNTPFLNLNEWQSNYDSIGLLTKEQWDVKTSEEGNLTIASKSYRDSIADADTESKYTVPFAEVTKASVKKVLNKIKNGSKLSEDEEKLKKRLAGDDRSKEDKKRFNPYVSEWLKENFRGDLKNLAQRLKSNSVVKVDEAMQSIGYDDEWLFSLLKGSLLWHCNQTNGDFYEYFSARHPDGSPKKIKVECEPYFISDEAREKHGASAKPDVYAFVVVE